MLMLSNTLITVNNLETQNSFWHFPPDFPAVTSATFKVSSETRCKAVTGVPLWKYLHTQPADPNRMT